MDLIKIVKTGKAYRDKFNFYLSLGYNEKVAAVLTVMTYGDREAKYLVRKLGEEEFFSKAVRWFGKQESDRPEDALNDVLLVRRGERPPVIPYPIPPFPHTRVSPGHRFSMDHGNEVDCLRFDQESGSVPPSRLYDDASPVDFPGFSAPEGGSYLSNGAWPRVLLSPVGHTLLEQHVMDTLLSLEEGAFEDTVVSPVSTLCLNTSNTSTGILFNQLRGDGRARLAKVRREELMNAFDYRCRAPLEERFSVTTEVRTKTSGKKLLFLGVQAVKERREHQNIVLLLDISGSMGYNAEVTQAVVATVLSKLQPGDIFSLISYGNWEQIVVKGYEFRRDSDREELLAVLMGLEIGWRSYRSVGIETAYQIGARYRREGWSNQVILITDGDLNFGITANGDLERFIEEKKRTGLFLSVIGTGLYNYRDDKLEALSKHGNGTYCVVNSLEDVDEFVNLRYYALTNVVAKDVKAQVEFNPRFVRSYRLLGYENRRLAHRDFRDDTVISEPYGSGGCGVALYELEMREEDDPLLPELKYQTPQLTGSDELCTVHVRFKEPLGEKSRLIEAIVTGEEHSTENLELAYSVYCIGERLRGSKLTDADDAAQLDRLLGGNYTVCSDRDKAKMDLLIRAIRRKDEE